MARSLRGFMIAFLIAVVILSIAAIYAVPFLNGLITEIFTGTPVGPADVPNDPNNSDNPGTVLDENDKVSGNTFTVLFIAADESGQYADAVTMMKVDKENKRFMFSPIPTNVILSISGLEIKDDEPITLSSIYYTHGCDYLVEAVSAMTGMYIDYYVSVDQLTFINLIDKLGGVSFHVPYKMTYYWDDAEQKGYYNVANPNGNYEIYLEEGTQVLDGRKSLMLMRFKGYTTGEDGRRIMQLNFLKYLFRQYLTPENLLKSGELYEELSQGITTNLTLGDFVSNAELLFKFSDYEILPTVTFPTGTSQFFEGKEYFLYDEQTVRASYAPYK